MSAANGIMWPPLVRAVLSVVPEGHAGAGSGIFFTVRYIGSSLSFTLALVVAELSIPPALAVRIYLGSAGRIGAHAAVALVHSIDTGFRLFVGIYLVAAATTLFLFGPRVSRRDAPDATGRDDVVRVPDSR
jgi:hypothetical protein